MKNKHILEYNKYISGTSNPKHWIKEIESSLKKEILNKKYGDFTIKEANLKDLVTKKDFENVLEGTIELKLDKGNYSELDQLMMDLEDIGAADSGMAKNIDFAITTEIDSGYDYDIEWEISSPMNTPQDKKFRDKASDYEYDLTLGVSGKLMELLKIRIPKILQ